MERRSANPKNWIGGWGSKEGKVTVSAWELTVLHSFPRSHSFLSHPSASQSHGEYKGAENLQCTLPKARKSCSPCKSGSSQGQGRGAGSEPPPAVGGMGSAQNRLQPPPCPQAPAPALLCTPSTCCPCTLQPGTRRHLRTHFLMHQLDLNKQTKKSH